MVTTNRNTKNRHLADLIDLKPCSAEDIVAAVSDVPFEPAMRFLAACIGGLMLGLMLAAPQLLPTLELSRMSHRTGKPTKEGYQAYIDYALPLGGRSRASGFEGLPRDSQGSNKRDGDSRPPVALRDHRNRPDERGENDREKGDD